MLAEIAAGSVPASREVASLSDVGRMAGEVGVFAVRGRIVLQVLAEERLGLCNLVLAGAGEGIALGPLWAEEMSPTHLNEAAREELVAGGLAEVDEVAEAPNSAPPSVHSDYHSTVVPGLSVAQAVMTASDQRR
jgi:hypothetical protein